MYPPDTSINSTSLSTFSIQQNFACFIFLARHLSVRKELSFVSKTNLYVLVNNFVTTKIQQKKSKYISRCMEFLNRTWAATYALGQKKMVGEIRERIFVIVSFWTIHNTTNYNYLFILTFIEANSNLNQGVYNERVFKPYSQDISIRARIKSLSSFSRTI